jgi:hypothetical protein
MKVGDTITVTRTFTVQDVQDFARISEDRRVFFDATHAALACGVCVFGASLRVLSALRARRGPWHTTPDEQGRLVVHGLATVALTTKARACVRTRTHKHTHAHTLASRHCRALPARVPARTRMQRPQRRCFGR